MRVTAILVVFAWSGAQVAAQAPTLSFDDARKAVAAERNRLWNDQAIRDAEISAPHPCPFLPDDICVCVGANAKTTRLYFSGGKIVDSIGPLRADTLPQCGSFTPFPELNGSQ